MANSIKDYLKLYFGAIDSREQALKVLKEASYAFWFVAVLMTGAGLLGLKGVLADVSLYAILPIFLFFKQSRVAAVMLFIWSVVVFFLTVGNFLGLNFGGGKNVILALIVSLCSISALRGSFKYHALLEKDGLAKAKIYTLKKAIIREILVFLGFITVIIITGLAYGFTSSETLLGISVLLSIGYPIYLIIRIIIWIVRKTGRPVKI